MDPIDQKPAPQPKVQSAKTPENTPIPGAGSWRWDADLCTWVAVDPV